MNALPYILLQNAHAKLVSIPTSKAPFSDEERVTYVNTIREDEKLQEIVVPVKDINSVDKFFKTTASKTSKYVIANHEISSRAFLGSGSFGSVFGVSVKGETLKGDWAMKVQVQNHDLAIRELKSGLVMKHFDGFEGPPEHIMLVNCPKASKKCSIVFSPWYKKSTTLVRLKPDLRKHMFIPVIRLLCESLQRCCTMQLIHGDIKEDNVIVIHKGKKLNRVMLIDWGRSIHIPLILKSQIGSFEGDKCRADMQPWTMRLDLPWMFDLDTFALAAMIHSVLTGKKIQSIKNGESLELDISPSIPKSWRHIIDLLKNYKHDPTISVKLNAYIAQQVYKRVIEHLIYV